MEEKEIFADVINEGDPIKDTPEETGTESQPENKSIAKEPSQEGEPKEDNIPDEDKLPFHKHPRWIAQRRKLEEYEDELEDLRKFREEAEPVLKGMKEPKETMPDWWKSTYGETSESEQAYRIYTENTKAERERIKAEVLQEVEARESRESESYQKGEEDLKNQVAEMKEEGLKFDEQKLAKFMIDFEQEFGPGSLLDSTGNKYDLRKSLLLMQRMNPQPTDTSIEKKKQIASDSMKTKVKPVRNDNIPIISRRALGPKGSWRDFSN